MRVWAQFSQRSTWPPSAAVRQTSIAVIDAPLAEAQTSFVGSTPSGTVAAENVRHFEPLDGTPPAHQSGAVLAMFRSSSGLWICRMMLIATRA